MNLSFSTQWPERMGALAGKPNYFVEKIIAGLPKGEYLESYLIEHAAKHILTDGKDLVPKITTIRKDEHDRWHEGMDIHFIINNRTPQRFQFAPIIKCVSTQKIEIKYAFPHRYIFVDGKYLSEWKDMEQLALNDGFDTVENFFKYFNEDFSGKIIHWTDSKY